MLRRRLGIDISSQKVYNICDEVMIWRCRGCAWLVGAAVRVSESFLKSCGEIALGGLYRCGAAAVGG